MNLDALESEDRGFLTYVATLARVPLPAFVERLAGGDTALTEAGTQLERLDLSVLGRALREKLGARRLALPLGGLDALRTLDVTGLGLDELDLRPLRDLRAVRCAGNQLRALDVSSHPGLELLDCGDNPLETLVLGDQPALRELRCGSTALRALAVAGCPRLRVLDCAGSAIADLDVTENPLLDDLHAGGAALVATEAQHARLATPALHDGGVTSVGAMNRWELHRLARAFVRGNGGAEAILLQIARAPGCDRGTAAMIYWAADPHQLPWTARSKVPRKHLAAWELVTAIEARFAAGDFATAEILYDPRAEDADRTVAPATGGRRIPPELFDPRAA